MKSLIRFFAVVASCFCTCVRGAEAPSAAGNLEAKPNILLVFTEDWSVDLSCYGNHDLKTPNIDAFAKGGRMYWNAYCTAPVCSPSRSAMMTGFDQHTIGAQHHRTADKKPLPDGIRPIPHLLEDAGYFTCLLDKKTDCNFTTDKPLFMGKDWSERPAGKPFFAQCTLGVSHRPFSRDAESPIDPAKVKLPSFYPDTPLIRRDWANGLESMQIADRQFGKLLDRLRTEGLEQNTLVIFAGDNGLCHARGKQFLYEAGIHVPLLIRWPDHVKAGEVNRDLVSSLDISASILAAAGVKPKVPVQGMSFFDGSTAKREAVFAGRDLMDETHDAMRCVRTRRYKLIHNLMPDRPWTQRNRYKENYYPGWAVLHLWHLRKQLTPQQEAFMASSKPDYELYDLEKDPEELRNLANDPALATVKKDLIARLEKWQKDIRDPGIDDAFRKGGGDWQSVTDEKFWQERVQRFEKRLRKNDGNKVPAPSH